jgi:hypothetical protein
MIRVTKLLGLLSVAQVAANCMSAQLNQNMRSRNLSAALGNNFTHFALAEDKKKKKDDKNKAGPSAPPPPKPPKIEIRTDEHGSYEHDLAAQKERLETQQRLEKKYGATYTQSKVKDITKELKSEWRTKEKNGEISKKKRKEFEQNLSRITKDDAAARKEKEAKNQKTKDSKSSSNNKHSSSSKKNKSTHGSSSRSKPEDRPSYIS